MILLDEVNIKAFFDTLEEKILNKKMIDKKYSLTILNATERKRLAAQARNILQKSDINILEVDNYKTSSMPNSFFIEHSGSTAFARNMQKILNFDSSRIIFMRKLTDIDGTLILGEKVNLKRFRPDKGK